MAKSLRKSRSRKKYIKNRSHKKSNRRKKNRTLKKQKGGMMSAIGLAAAGIGVATTAYLGLNILSKIRDTSILNALLNSDEIAFLPKYQVIETPKFTKQYLQSIDTVTLFRKFIDNPDLMRSKSLYSILKTVSEMGQDLKDISQNLKKLELTMNITDREKHKLFVSKTTLSHSNNLHLKELENYLLATAKEPGKENSELPELKTDTEKDRYGNINLTENPYLANRNVNWFNVITDGIYDEKSYNEAVDAILKERGSYSMIHKEEIREHLQMVKKNKLFQRAIREKMNECVGKPRGLIDYITNNINWDAAEKCLKCPQEDCLIYIYKFY